MASIAKIDGKWRALIRRKGHKQISKYFTTKGAALLWAAEIEQQIDSGQVKAVESADTIAKVIERYKTMRSKTRPILDTSTEHYTLKMLSKTMGHILAAKLTVADLTAWALERRDDGAGPYTINCDLSKLGTVFRYAGEGLPDIIGEARPKLSYLGLIGGGGLRERRPTDDELQRIYEWLERNKGRKYRDFVEFSVLTAMRRGEVARIAWADLDAEKKMVLVRDRKDPRQKIGNDQWVPLLGASWDLVQAQPKDDARIFPIHHQTMTGAFTLCCKELGIPDLHLHDMRHEGISAMFESGYAIQQVAVVSGHRSWNHLKRYTQIKPESLHSHVPNQGKPPSPDSQSTAVSHRGKS